MHLREIAEETITKEQLKNDLIEEYQTNTFSEDEDINEIEDNSDENQSETNELEMMKIIKMMNNERIIFYRRNTY